MRLILLVEMLLMEIILGLEGNHVFSNNRKILFWVFLQVCNPSFHLHTKEYEYLRFSSILWFLQF